jgi:hypothetical protein
MEHSADTDWLLRENLELHRQLRIATAFLEKCYHSNGGAKGITAPTEQEWQDIFDMLQQISHHCGFATEAGAFRAGSLRVDRRFV